MKLPYFFGYETQTIFLHKQSQKYRSVLQDGSRSLGLFRKGKTSIIAKFQETYFFVVISERAKPGLIIIIAKYM